MRSMRIWVNITMIFTKKWVTPFQISALRIGIRESCLFVYPETKVRGFWMKDTRIPLSIAFADADGVIVRIADMKPFDETRTSSLYPAKYALEMEKGWFAKKGIAKGATIEGIPDDLDPK